MSYHLNTIQKGEIGEVSKIQEELDELKDAIEQNCKLMALIELADLYGSIECYLESKFPNTTMNDLKIMSNITKRAFKSGTRK